MPVPQTLAFSLRDETGLEDTSAVTGITTNSINNVVIAAELRHQAQIASIAKSSAKDG